MGFRDDDTARDERTRTLERELAAARAELEQVRAAQQASAERARMFEAEADRLRALGASRRASKVGFDSWMGAVVLAFAAGFGAALFVFMVALGR